MESAEPVFFKDTQSAPPCGYFYETHGVRIRARTFVEIEPKVRALMAKFNIPGTPEMAVAAYMCPRLDDPGRYCEGSVKAVPHVLSLEAYKNSTPYTTAPVVPFDRVARRERVCAECPKHQRDWCPTCTGHIVRLSSMFEGKRPDLPEDKVTGVCGCARAYEYAICSVKYGDKDPIWDGAPDTCWRHTDV